MLSFLLVHLSGGCGGRKLSTLLRPTHPPQLTITINPAIHKPSRLVQDRPLSKCGVGSSIPPEGGMEERRNIPPSPQYQYCHNYIIIMIYITARYISLPPRPLTVSFTSLQCLHFARHLHHTTPHHTPFFISFLPSFFVLHCSAFIVLALQAQST